MKLMHLWGIALALLAGTTPATTLHFSADPPAVHAGETFTLDVRLTDVTALYGYQFDFEFDPTIIQVHAVVEGEFLATGGAQTSFLPGDIDNALGTVLFTANTLLGPAGGATGSGVLAHLSFLALAEGTSILALRNVVLLDSTLADITGTPIGSAIQVSAVPEPAIALLFGIGVAGLAAGSRRRLWQADAAG